MRIALTVDDYKTEEPTELLFDNHGIDNDNFVTMFIDGVEAYSINVNELKNAIQTFYQLRMDRLNEEALM